MSSGNNTSSRAASRQGVVLGLEKQSIIRSKTYQEKTATKLETDPHEVRKIHTSRRRNRKLVPSRDIVYYEEDLAPTCPREGGCRNLEVDNLTVDLCARIKCLNVVCKETVEKDLIVLGNTSLKNTTVDGLLDVDALVAIDSLSLPLIAGIPAASPSPAGQILYDTIDRLLFISDGTTWQIYDDGEAAPPNITVDPSLVANDSTIFNTIMGAINSLRNRRTSTTISIAPYNVYPENILYLARLSSTDPNAASPDFTTLRIHGDSRDIAGCGIGHDCVWNRQSVPGPVGGGSSPLSRAVLSGTLGGTTLSVTAFSYAVGTASQAGTTVTGVGTTFTPYMVGGLITFSTPSTAVTVTAYVSPTVLTVNTSQTVAATTYILAQGVSPNFVAAGVVHNDRVAVRHNQGTVPQFAIYTITSVSGPGNTILNLSSPLLGNVNAVGSAICIVPNVEIAPLAGVVCSMRGVAALKGIFFNALTISDILRLQYESALYMSNCFFYGGDFHLTMYRSALRTDSNTFGNTFFNAKGQGLFSYGNSVADFTNNLVCPGPGTIAILSQRGAEVTISTTNVIGSGTSTSGLVTASTGTINFAQPQSIICSAGIAVLAATQGSITLNINSVARIRGCPGVGPSIGVSVTAFSRLGTTSTVPGIVIDCADSPSSFIAVAVGDPSGSPAFGGSDAVVSLDVLATPANSTLARVSSGSLTITRIQSEFVGPNSNGFQLLAGSIMRWIAQGSGQSDFTGGGGTGILFDVREGSSLNFNDASVTRNLKGFGTIFSFDTNSSGYITAVTCTTSGSGANTNLLVKNNANVLLGTAKFNVSGANIGIQQVNGGIVKHQSGSVLTNAAATPVVGPTVGTNTGDITATSVVAGSIDLQGSITCTATTGGLLGSFKVTFSAGSSYVVAPVIIATGGAIVTPVSTTGFIVSLITPSTSFTINYTGST